MLKSIIAAAGTVLMSSALVFAQNSDITPLAIGTQLPAFSHEFETADGKFSKVEMPEGSNGLLVMFSCNTCPYVVKAQERTKEVLAYAAKNNIKVLIINSNEAKRGDDDSKKAMQAYAQKQGYTVPYVVDKNSEIADAFGATRTPEIFLFDPMGKLFYHGAMEDNPGSPAESTEFYVEQAINNLAAGVPANPAETKSIGCTIKRKS